MNMYALIEDARSAALDAANCWADTPEAKELLAKADAFERLSDRWYGECPTAAKGFAVGADEMRDALDDLRDKAVDAAADTYSDDKRSDEWIDAWNAADDEAPSVEQEMQSARRNHAGDEYLRRFG